MSARLIGSEGVFALESGISEGLRKALDAANYAGVRTALKPWARVFAYEPRQVEVGASGTRKRSRERGWIAWDGRWESGVG